MMDKFNFPESIRINALFAFCVTSTCVIGVVIIGKITGSRRRHRRVREKGESCREACRKLAQQLEENGLSPAQRNTILDLPFEELRQKLQDGDLKCVDVLHAYQSKAMEVNEQLNCVVEPIWEAEVQALERDMVTGKKGPLHGIPVSVKENYYIEGYECTAGMSIFLDKIPAADSILIQVLKKQGAIPFVRTNIPQALMSYECSNPMYGVTKNPYDVTRGPGGSSGGEGALITAKGSLVGFGTDIGGSIRIPCHMCGVCGIKPTAGRLSKVNLLPLDAGQSLIQEVTGPLSADVGTLVAVMKALLVPQMFELDPTCPPLQFRDEIFESKKPLRIGYFLDNGHITPAPACQRAVTMATEILRANGHTLVEFEPPSAEEAFELFMCASAGDGGRSVVDDLKDDVLDPSVRLAYYSMTLPSWLCVFLGWVMSKIDRDKMVYTITKSMVGSSSVYQYWNVAEKIDVYKKKMLRRWKACRLDVLIGPGFAYPAVRTGNVFNVVGGVTYASFYNLINYPAGSVPVTNVMAEDEAKMADYPAVTTCEKEMKKDAVGTKGLPVNVQCAALPYQEELVLRVMAELEQGLKK